MKTVVHQQRSNLERYFYSVDQLQTNDEIDRSKEEIEQQELEMEWKLLELKKKKLQHIRWSATVTQNLTSVPTAATHRATNKEN